MDQLQVNQVESACNIDNSFFKKEELDKISYERISSRKFLILK